MSSLKVSLTQQQITFIVNLVEIENKNEAIKYFGNLMVLEGLKVTDMSKVVDKLMRKLK